MIRRAVFRNAVYRMNNAVRCVQFNPVYPFVAVHEVDFMLPVWLTSTFSESHIFLIVKNHFTVPFNH